MFNIWTHFHRLRKTKDSFTQASCFRTTCFWAMSSQRWGSLPSVGMLSVHFNNRPVNMFLLATVFYLYQLPTVKLNTYIWIPAISLFILKFLGSLLLLLRFNGFLKNKLDLETYHFNFVINIIFKWFKYHIINC